MIDALIAGERDPQILADLARARMRAKIPALRDALVGRFTDHHAFICRTMLDRIDADAKAQFLPVRMSPGSAIDRC
ncbi:hypothetical protein [Micromonospora ureilytica]|uniref:hypothetical protein n=1 Tax=Micromonospora ureilytica TaxID=709868 RepID=UPI00197C6D03|nr:hypothetical protein [Micromonospora ureilytica]